MEKYMYTLANEKGGFCIELPVLIAIGSLFDYYSETFEVSEYQIEDDDSIMVLCFKYGM